MKTETKWAAGPWTVHLDEMYSIIAGKEGRLAHATFLRGPHGLNGRRDSDEAAANTRLMAAAPDLYDALHGLTCELEDCAQPGDWEYYRDAVAAMAKARGES